jgi:hypothetical protein
MMQMKLDWLSATFSGFMVGAISIISSVSFAALHRFIADLLAERLLRTTNTLERVLNQAAAMQPSSYRAKL